MNPDTDTPRTDAAIEPLAAYTLLLMDVNAVDIVWPEFARQLERELNEAKQWLNERYKALSGADERADKAESEVERLTQRMKEAEDLIKGLHDGWKKARKAHLETCKNAQREIDKLHAENVCLQELIQEFYEWSRRDFPTEQEVREIMNRYHDLLNK